MPRTVYVVGSGGGGVTTFNTRSGAVTPANGDYTVSQVTGAAPTASPALTGTPTAPTASVGTNTTQLATTAFVLANAGSGPNSYSDGTQPLITAGNAAYLTFGGVAILPSTKYQLILNIEALASGGVFTVPGINLAYIYDQSSQIDTGGVFSLPVTFSGSVAALTAWNACRYSPWVTSLAGSSSLRVRIFNQEATTSMLINRALLTVIKSQ